jgi:hypothetical protein
VPGRPSASSDVSVTGTGCDPRLVVVLLPVVAMTASLDDAARRRLIAAHRAALIDVASTVSDALIGELVKLGVEPLSQDASIDQIKVAQAQLFGWINGVILAAVTLGSPTRVVVDDDPIAPEGPNASHVAR